MRCEHNVLVAGGNSLSSADVASSALGLGGGDAVPALLRGCNHDLQGNSRSALGQAAASKLPL